MKHVMRKSSISFIVILSLLAALFSCNKDDENIEEEMGFVDYRDQYVGDYVYEVKGRVPFFAYVPEIDDYSLFYKDSTWTYYGYVAKSEDIEKLIIHWGERTIATINNVPQTMTTEAPVDSSGMLTFPDYLVQWDTPESRLANDSVWLYLTIGSYKASTDWRAVGAKIN
jgi:hypothetical protein